MLVARFVGGPHDGRIRTVNHRSARIVVPVLIPGAPGIGQGNYWLDTASPHAWPVYRYGDSPHDATPLAPTGWTSREHTPGPMSKPGAPWVGKAKKGGRT